MNIAIVDVAAENGGALSVLFEFYQYVRNSSATSNHWYFFTSVVDLEETEQITVIKAPFIKKSWFHRGFWEYNVFPQKVKEYHMDVILSLQNKALPIKGKKQIVYFHNVLHLMPLKMSNLFDKTQRSGFIYRKIVTPITMHSYKYCDTLITQTRTVKEELAKKVKVKKIVAIYPEINIGPYSGNNSIKGFIYPCNPAKHKNHELIIEAMRIAGNQFSGIVIFTFTGKENNYASMLREKTKEFNNIKFVGFLPRQELLEKYQDYGLIFASNAESFPIPFAEAMAYGTPILARNMPYAQEILEGYKNSYLYQDATELSKLLCGWENLRRQEGIKKEENSSWEKVIQMVVSNDL